MGQYNSVALIGYLGQNPETRVLPSEVRVSRISLATTKRWKDKDGKMEEATQWHKVVLWRGLSKIAEDYLRKGMQVFIEGEVQYRKFELNGEKYNTAEIIANRLQILGKRGDSSSSDISVEDDVPYVGSN